jgi:hypothetical protein
MALVVNDCARADSEQHVRASSTKQQRQPTWRPGRAEFAGESGLDRILSADSPIFCTASLSLACLVRALGLVSIIRVLVVGHVLIQERLLRPVSTLSPPRARVAAGGVGLDAIVVFAATTPSALGQPRVLRARRRKGYEW